MNNIERLMGLDIGERRIGVAVSDALGLTAQPLTVIYRDQKGSDLKTILDLIHRYEIGGIVVGLPIRTSGFEGPESEKVRSFIAELEEILKLPVHWIDERFTTVIAERTLKERGLKTPARRRVVDKVAATLILQSYLDRRRLNGV